MPRHALLPSPLGPSQGNPLDHGPCQVCRHDQAVRRLKRVEEDGPGCQLPHQVQQEAAGDALEGDEAAELTAAKYGRSEWWLLLEPKPAGQ